MRYRLSESSPPSSIFIRHVLQRISETVLNSNQVSPVVVDEDLTDIEILRTTSCVPEANPGYI